VRQINWRFFLEAILPALLPRSTAGRLVAAALFAAALPALAEAPLPVSNVRVAGHALRVEVVATMEQRAKGLMFRKKLGKNDGMLFVFEEPAYHAMWMKNTLIPLSVAFIDGEGRILNIADMEPETLDSHAAAGPARFAIETNKGWFAERKVVAGSKVTGLPKLAK
ncbi:MAG TPA: DUF192 domain-containing protein, partial [Usitatibacteraceae bacterium]|nr:DUF192 domain-containing protein [Usitatibacteraceae bacterium]